MGASSGVYRRKLNTSCWKCRMRKVKCDATGDGPCTACKRMGVECRPHPNQLQRKITHQRNSTVSQTTTNFSKSGDFQNPSPESQLSISDQQSAFNETLSKFFETGVISTNWDHFEENGTFRNVYIGTHVANMHHLVRDHEPPETSYLFYPFPAIRDEIPWKPRLDISRHAYLNQNSVNDLSSLPIKPVRDSLVETYFKDIHPGFPIIDQAEFRRQYVDNDNPPPLLLLQTMLLVAARISDHPQIATSRTTTIATLYRRAKTLFELRHETDRVDLVQAALLLAWFNENSDNVSSNGYHWVGNAVRIAFGMGLHRASSIPYVPKSRSKFYRKYKRTWWLAFYSEIMLALEHGRPSMIRIEDFDVGLLDEDDLKNMDDTEDSDINSGFCFVLIELSLIALDIISLRSPHAKDNGLSMTALQNRLAAVALNLRPNHDFWSCQLRIIYESINLALHRTINEEGSMKLCSEAASSILITFEAMVVHNTIRQCHLSSLPALMAAAIQFSRDIRGRIMEGSILLAISAHGQLTRLAVVAKTLGSIFSNIEAIQRLCESLSTRSEVMIKNSQRDASMSTPQVPEGFDIDWDDIMTNYRIPNIAMGLETAGGDWLNEYL